MPPPTATGPNGEKLVLQNGQWVPIGPMLTTPAPTRAQPTKYAAQNPENTPLIRQGLKQTVGELVANMIGLPHAAGELLATGAAGLRTGAGAAVAAVKGEPINLAERYKESREIEAGMDGSFAKALLSWPNPTGDEVLEAVGVKPAESGVAQVSARSASDIATLLTLRPGQRASELLKLRSGATASDRRGRLMARERGSVPEETRNALDEAAKKLWGATGKAAEAGFEGAVVGALGDGDPINTAAWSAGIQAGGSAALGAKSWMWKNPGKAAFTLLLGHEMYRAVAPGPQDFYQSKDEVVQEFVASYGLGTAAALAGAGRPVGHFSQLLSRASRAGVASVVTQLQEASNRGQEHYGQVISKLSEDPDYFGQEIRIRLERAANSDKPNELLNEIDRLMKSTRFRKQFDEAFATDSPQQ